MKKTIYLHIGIGKTGTSALQKTFFEEKEILQNQGMYIPVTGLADNNIGHHKLANFNETEPSENTIRQYSLLDSELASIEQDKILISSEYFCFCKPDFITFLKHRFEKYDLKIVFFVREHIKFVESAFLWWQSQGYDYKYNINDYFEMAGAAFNYMWLINKWAECFGDNNIIVKVYDKKLINDGIVEYFFKDVCDNILIPAQKENINKSLLPCYSPLISFLDTSLEGFYIPNSSTDARKTIILKFIEISDANISLDEIMEIAIQFTQDQGLIENYFNEFKKNLDFNFTLIDDLFKSEILNYYEDSNLEFSNRFLSNDQKNIFLKMY